MRSTRTPYNAARTHSLLNAMPNWIRKDADGFLYKWLNTLGMESELFAQQMQQTRDNLHPFYMDTNQATNIHRVNDLPVRDSKYYGKKGSLKFNLNQVTSERELFDNLPTRLSLEGGVAIDTTAPVLNIRYLEDVPFAALTIEKPSKTGSGLFIIDEDGSVLSQSEIGITTQSYAAAGEDEEIVFESNEATLAHTPIAGTLKIYDILNLTNGAPTEITTFTLSGAVVTWTGGSDPEGRYIAEYDYADYEGIRSLIPDIYRWDVAYNTQDTGYDLQYLRHDDYTYDGSDYISANTRLKDLTLLDLEIDDTPNYFLKLNPLECRAGRTIDVNVTGTKIYTDTWADPTSNYVLDLPAQDSNYIDTSAASIQVFNGSNEVTSEFSTSVDLPTGVITIYGIAGSAYTDLNLNIFYRATLTGTGISVTNHTEYFTYEGKELYYSKADITSLINQSATIPKVFEINATAEEEYVAQLKPLQHVGFTEEALVVDVYLEKYNQALHFKESYGESEYTVLLNLPDPGTTSYKSIKASDLNFTPSGGNTSVALGSGEYELTYVDDPTAGTLTLDDTWLQYTPANLSGPYTIKLKAKVNQGTGTLSIPQYLDSQFGTAVSSVNVTSTDYVDVEFNGIWKDDNASNGSIQVVFDESAGQKVWIIDIEIESLSADAVDSELPLIYQTDLLTHKAFDVDTPQNIITVGNWEYRDMLMLDDHILLLRTSVDPADTTYLPKGAVNYAKSEIDFFNLLSGDIEHNLDNLPANAVSITFGKDERLYFLAHETDDLGDAVNTLYNFKLLYDYIYMVQEDDTLTAYVRSPIDSLITEYDDGL